MHEEEEDVEAETTAQIRKETQESLEQNFTPSLARRLSRQFIEQTRQSVPRSPSMPRDNSRYYQSPTREMFSLIGTNEIAKRSFDQTEYRGRSLDRGIRRTNSLLEPSRLDRLERHSPRRSISLFEDDDNDKLLQSLPKHIMTLGRKYKESGRRDNFYGHYRTDKIQEEPGDDAYMFTCKEDINNSNIDNNVENGSVSESTSISVCNSNANLIETTTSSVSARSCETSPTESSSNVGDYSKSDISKSFESRLLAAENLIKESKLKNLTRFNPNLSCNYKDTDKCDKEALITSTDQSSASSVASKRRSCIPSLRLRSVSLTREPSVSTDRRKSFANTQDALTGSANQERSILSKFFRSGSSKEAEPKDKSQKPKQHRISRFLRPDFFDTPREESQYVKEKEAQKAAENERRKSRFMRRKSENKDRKDEKNEEPKEEKICKEQKNEINALQKDKLDVAVTSENKSSKNEDKEKTKIERQGSKSSFLHTLEKKLERLRSNDETTSADTKAVTNGGIPGDQKERGFRECSAPPVECPVNSKPTEVKRTLSVEDMTKLDKVTKNTPSKGRVTSVLGLFKTSSDVKQNASSNGRSQNVIMSKLKRSPPKSVKPIESLSEDDATGTSRIPTKSARTDSKSAKKVSETKRSPEKSECKKSPPKEKSKEKEPVVKERKSLIEKQPREFKKPPERVAQADSSSSADKIKPAKTESATKFSDESESSLQNVVVDNKHMESVTNGEEKKLLKTKKNISSLSKNESVTRIDKGEEIDKKIKKPVKPKEVADKDEINGAKKKKFVRVVRKVVKKTSDSSESKSDEKEKSSKPVVKKKIIIAKKEKSPESSNITAIESTKSSNVQETSSVKPDNAERTASNTNTVSKTDAAGNHAASFTSDANISSTNLSQTSAALQNASSSSQNCANHVIQNGAVSSSAHSSAPTVQQNISSSNVRQAKQSEQQRPNRANLKLDLTKIPQHTFRHTTPKRDSPKSGSPPKANPAMSAGSPKTDVPAAESGSDKLMECLSKMTHHANITGNKIIIDKPLRAKDVAELKREVTECATIIENHIESRNDRAIPQNVEAISKREPIEDKKMKEIKIDPPKEINDVYKVVKGPVEDCNSEMFSPEEPESFDSWSICSADLNHNRSDLHSPQLHSPTSPSYSLFMRGDSSESIIDRIRRRSFYSRFNDRKRPSLTAPPPGLSVSATLPRRFSFNGPRERERNRYYNYGISRTR